MFNSDTGEKEIDSLRAGLAKDIWDIALSSKWDQLSQGNIHGMKGTDTVEFIHQGEVPTEI